MSLLLPYCHLSVLPLCSNFRNLWTCKLIRPSICNAFIPAHLTIQRKWRVNICKVAKRVSILETRDTQHAVGQKFQNSAWTDCSGQMLILSWFCAFSRLFAADSRMHSHAEFRRIDNIAKFDSIIILVAQTYFWNNLVRFNFALKLPTDSFNREHSNYLRTHRKRLLKFKMQFKLLRFIDSNTIFQLQHFGRTEQNGFVCTMKHAALRLGFDGGRDFQIDRRGELCVDLTRVSEKL